MIGDYYIENENGKKLFYDEVKDAYYFSDKPTGYSTFTEQSTAQKIVDIMCSSATVKKEGGIDEIAQLN